MTASYVHGASETPLIGETIGRFFDGAAERWGERTALVVRHQNVRFTYRELLARVDRWAAGLLGLGLRPGDRVGIWSHNNWEWVVIQLATAKAGLILVNINPAYRRSELSHVLEKVGIRCLILMPSFKTSDYVEMVEGLDRELFPELDFVVRLGDERTAGMLNFGEIPDAASDGSRARLDALRDELQFDDPINIQFTSGTTGLPKGATLTHHNVLNNGFFVGEAMRLSEEDILCIPVPLYHCFGMVLGNLAAVTHGSAMVYPGEAFEPEATLECVASERCTALHGVPTMFIAELDHPRFADLDLSSLRTGIMAGAPCPIEIMNRVVSEMHMSEVTIAYGMTETSPVSFQTAFDDPLDKRIGTVGRIHPHVEVKIVDRDDRVVPVGETGELCTRGYSVMNGYWGDEEATRAVIDEAGWMHTGDLATLDADGYGNIVGRIKDMVIRGGENIYPREIEEFLYTHPAIGDVQVIGVPDPRKGEELCAWIRIRDDVEKPSDGDIRAYCDGQIAHYKIPRYIRFVDSFPMTITGKVQKFKMREAMKRELGLIEDDTA